MYLRLRVNCPSSCQILMKLELSRHIFERSQVLNLIKIRRVGIMFFRDEDSSRFS